MTANGRVDGKVAIVTGAANGIGAATAELLAAEGASVVIADIDVSAGEAVACQINACQAASAQFVAHDVSDEASWDALLEATLARFGKLQILVNNAGIQITRPLEEISLDEWHYVFRINADGPFLGTRAAIGAMKKNGGSIVNVSSTYAMVADGLNAHYCASKAAVRNFTKAAALYCADNGYAIRVNSVHPGVIETPMLRREIEAVTASRHLSSTGPVEAEWAKLCPLGMGSPGDIAQGILYLASDAARYVTGAELVIDGGHIIR